MVVAIGALFTGVFGIHQTSLGEERVLANPFTLPDLQGKIVRLADLKGDVILINFWATWCGDCLLEMPEFEKLYQKLKGKGLSILAVSLDKKGAAEIEAFLKNENLNLTYPILLDPDGHVSRAYGISWVPATIIIGRNGKVIERILGVRPWGGKQAMKSFEHLLKLRTVE